MPSIDDPFFKLFMPNPESEPSPEQVAEFEARKAVVAKLKPEYLKGPNHRRIRKSRLLDHGIPSDVLREALGDD